MAGRDYRSALSLQIEGTRLLRAVDELLADRDEVADDRLFVGGDDRVATGAARHEGGVRIVRDEPDLDDGARHRARADLALLGRTDDQVMLEPPCPTSTSAVLSSFTPRERALYPAA